ncbi:MAG: hypothetical protein IKK63_02345 [Clostridia bacterium]|nr:hypothetical protein [Clostridia bacterium]MBR3819657.1 hypothetical protein [Clostridia bacterium]
MSTKNILTGVVVALALVLVLVVILVKTGVFDGAQTTTTEPEIEETKIVVVTGTDVNGNTFEYTMMSKYKPPKVSSNFIYPTRKKTTTTTTEPESTTAPLFIEETSAVQVTDPDGEPVTDENGVPVTEIVTYTVPVTESTTAEPTTAYSPRTSHVVVTNKLGIVQKDENGNPKTEIVTIDPPAPTQGDIWSESAVPGTTSKHGINAGVTVVDNLEQAILEQLNQDRLAAGATPLNNTLKAKARTGATSKALPAIYGEPDGSTYVFVTDYTGQGVYSEVSSALSEKLLSADTSSIGIGVIEYQDKYYTCVIFS